jgi:hypothetical protein
MLHVLHELWHLSQISSFTSKYPSMQSQFLIFNSLKDKSEHLVQNCSKLVHSRQV